MTRRQDRTNLRVSPYENLHDAVRNGKKGLGENAPNAKLTEKDVQFIRTNANCTMNSLAMHLGVSCAAVRQVRLRNTWKHVA